MLKQYNCFTKINNKFFLKESATSKRLSFIIVLIFAAMRQNRILSQICVTQARRQSHIMFMIFY